MDGTLELYSVSTGGAVALLAPASSSLVAGTVKVCMFDEMEIMRSSHSFWKRCSKSCWSIMDSLFELGEAV